MDEFMASSDGVRGLMFFGRYQKCHFDITSVSLEDRKEAMHAIQNTMKDILPRLTKQMRFAEHILQSEDLPEEAYSTLYCSERDLDHTVKTRVVKNTSYNNGISDKTRCLYVANIWKGDLKEDSLLSAKQAIYKKNEKYDLLLTQDGRWINWRVLYERQTNIDKQVEYVDLHEVREVSVVSIASDLDEMVLEYHPGVIVRALSRLQKLMKQFHEEQKAFTDILEVKSDFLTGMAYGLKA